MFSNRKLLESDKLCLYRYTIDNEQLIFFGQKKISNVIEPKNNFSQTENVPVPVNVNKLFCKIAGY